MLVWVVDAVLVAEGVVVIEGVPDAVCDRVCVCVWERVSDWDTLGVAERLGEPARVTRKQGKAGSVL